MKQEVSHTQKVLNTWAIVLFVWAIYRYIFNTSLPIWFDEFITKPIIFLFPVIYFITMIEKKPILERLDLKSKKMGMDLLIGLGFGTLFLIVGALSQYLKMHTISIGPAAAAALPITIITAFATSFSEELLSRGFVLKRLLEESKNAFTSIFLASMLFFILHVPYLLTNSGIRGEGLVIVMVTDIIFSLIVSMIYVLRRNVWTAMLVHMCYILALTLFIT